MLQCVDVYNEEIEQMNATVNCYQILELITWLELKNHSAILSGFIFTVEIDP